MNVKIQQNEKSISQLMLLGSKGLEEIESQLFYVSKEGEVMGCCALGALYIGRFGLEQTKIKLVENGYEDDLEQDDDIFVEQLREAFPDLLKTDLLAGVKLDEGSPISAGASLGDAIVEMNDDHYSIPSIAKALEEVGL